MTDADAEETPSWAAGLLDEQRDAASYDGKNARLLAGPGTGKTWTLKARVEFLIVVKEIDPSAITALTFTRAAAGELRGRVNKALEGKFAERPHIMTLHSFALQTLLRNAKLIDALPQPLRVADDWEERCIVREDLKVLTKCNVRKVKDRLLELSADWETLHADDEEPSEKKADPKFLGAWQKHRAAYGYTLRSELVYQLKRAMEQRSDLELHGDIQHLLVDEYQDLNACDLSIISRVAAKGANVYAAGDDDQSIYGFRHASPEGIRAFATNYAPSTDLPLATCIRCDREIMDLARFVADLDPDRLDKPWKARDKAGQGEVQLIGFEDGQSEASGIASLCRYLIDSDGYEPDDILILIRSDKDRAFSRVLSEEMETGGVPFYLNLDAASPLDSDSGRVLLGCFRLAVDENDSLSWRTLLQVRKNKVGAKTIAELSSEALRSGNTFAAVLKEASVRRKASALGEEYAFLCGLLADVKTVIGDPAAVRTSEDLRDGIVRIIGVLTEHGITGLDDAFAHVAQLTENGEADSFKAILSVLALAHATPEQDLGRGAVNMLTMHKAKGLSSRAVIVMMCEDQYVPGRSEAGPAEGDERRLLYVSLTRAKERLFITYAEKRTGQQRHSGRDSGKTPRRLTRYLKDAPVHATSAAQFFSKLVTD